MAASAKGDRPDLDPQEHWDRVYTTKPVDGVSWFRPHLERSLTLIERADPHHSASIVDIGGGHSTLIDDLVKSGRTDLTVLDISQAALDVARARVEQESNGPSINWLRADITSVELPPSRFDIWHDRAVFHFLTAEQERKAYVRQALRAVKPGGHVIVATFGPDGPKQCSGLNVVNYDSQSLHDQFGIKFKLVQADTELHGTPFGTTQQFLYCFCKVSTD
ncbi:MAG TPA: class I SAM-dependent methyltransferase [Candidatus Obscuribacter sp.]|nr:class I SAM-dependent methyltransferase [Candidatus Obscuribacter sp.]